MTDTRKEFDDWIRNFNLDSSSNYYRVAYESWQACQSLNDKRIEQLLAVIAKKDEALNITIEALDGPIGEITNDYSGDEHIVNSIRSALALQPEETK